METAPTKEAAEKAAKIAKGRLRLERCVNFSFLPSRVLCTFAVQRCFHNELQRSKRLIARSLFPALPAACSRGQAPPQKARDRAKGCCPCLQPCRGASGVATAGISAGAIG